MFGQNRLLEAELVSTTCFYSRCSLLAGEKFMARVTHVCVSDLEKNYYGAIAYGNIVKQAIFVDDFNAPAAFHAPAAFYVLATFQRCL